MALTMHGPVSATPDAIEILIGVLRRPTKLSLSQDYVFELQEGTEDENTEEYFY